MLSCDQGPGAEDATQRTPGIKEFSVTPGHLSFDEDEDRIVDSLVTFSISVTPETPQPERPPELVVRARDENEPHFETSISSWDAAGEVFREEVEIPFMTAQIRTFEFFLFIPDEGRVGNQGRHILKVDGFAGEPPVVEESDHPETLQIPSEDEEPKSFHIAARITHPYGSRNIGRAEVDIIDSDGNSIGQFELERSIADNAGYGEDWYATGFSIDSGNQPENYSLHFYAEDTAGGRSDTLTSQMEFVR